MHGRGIGALPPEAQRPLCSISLSSRQHTAGMIVKTSGMLADTVSFTSTSGSEKECGADGTHVGSKDQFPIRLNSAAFSENSTTGPPAARAGAMSSFACAALPR